MDNLMHFHYTVDGNDFTLAGERSSNIKKTLKELGIAPELIRKTVIAVYEAEINLVIHAGGGEIDVDITPEKIVITLTDKGPGIPDVELAMKEGFSTADHKIRELGFGAGMGLPNIKKYSDEFDIHSVAGEGTTLKIAINLK